MATCILAAGPMTIAFMFLQKYFIRGITAGAVKG
jgi:putative aldouronate transport system permease protein